MRIYKRHQWYSPQLQTHPLHLGRWLLPINYIRLGIQMIRQIAQLAAYSGGHHLNLLLGPAQHACEQRIAVWLNAFENVDLVVAAKVFKFGVFGPGTLGELGDWLALPETERNKEGRGKKKKKGLLCRFLL